MLAWLAHYLKSSLHFLRVFDYLTFRSIIAALTALLMSLFGCPPLIRALTKMQIGQSVRNDGPQSHLKKSGTPTMGGVLIIFSVLVSVLLWGDLTNLYTWLFMVTAALFCMIGWIDDYRKVIKKNSKGLSARYKFVAQSVVALVVSLTLYFTASVPAQTELFIPFFKNAVVNLGFFYIILSYIVIVGSSNAVNLTDGLDGLALMPTVMVAAALGVFAYISGNHIFANYLEIPYLPGVSEIAVFASALVGAGLGFLWFNAYPAQIFMGDVGSLSLGAILGLFAVMVRQEIVFFFMSGIFVAETISVILQVASFKLTGKRIFRMAPLHHHFELKGWAEPKVIVRFWIITFILVLCGLATLKLR